MSIPPGGASCPPHGAPHSFWTGLSDQEGEDAVGFGDAFNIAFSLAEKVRHIDAGEGIGGQQFQHSAGRGGAQGAAELEGRGRTSVATRINDVRRDIFGQYGHAMTIAARRQYSIPDGDGYRATNEF